HHHAPAGHVLAAVVADALDDRVDAAVADAEPFAHDAAQVNLTGDRAVADDVAGNDVLLGLEGAVLRRVGDDPPARETLAQVIVRVAFQFQRHALGQEAPEALAGVAGE